MENEELHWRDVNKSDFLASWDMNVNAENLTIIEVKNEIAKLQKTETKVIAHFKEKFLSCGTKVKPMILNNTNLKFLQEHTGLHHQKLWKNVSVEISVVDNPSKIGGKKKLVITKASMPKFNIKEITDITDYKEAKSVATKLFGIMTAEEIEEVKKHLETIEKK